MLMQHDAGDVADKLFGSMYMYLYFRTFIFAAQFHSTALVPEQVSLPRFEQFRDPSSRSATCALDRQSGLQACLWR